MSQIPPTDPSYPPPPPPVPPQPLGYAPPPAGAFDWADEGESQALTAREVDVVLVIPPDFRSRLEQGQRPAVLLFSRRGDDRSAVGAEPGAVGQRRLAHAAGHPRSLGGPADGAGGR